MMTWAKFFSRVRVEGDCWVWTGANDGGLGYGKIYLSGGGQLKAHRVAWEMFNGDIKDGLFVLHHCDNPPCVNPAHLFLGTQYENIQDRHRKGRTSHGTSKPHAVLTDDIVRMAKTMFAMGLSKKQIAQGIGVSYVAIWHVLRGYSWKHVV